MILVVNEFFDQWSYFRRSVPRNLLFKIGQRNKRCIVSFRYARPEAQINTLENHYTFRMISSLCEKIALCGKLLYQTMHLIQRIQHELINPSTVVYSS